MKWVTRILFGVGAIGLLALIGFNVFKKQIAQTIFERVINERVANDPSAALPDGLHVYLCGTGAPLPDQSRAGPCLGVLAGDRAYVFDIGSGGARNLGTMGFPTSRIDSIFITHLHSDHIDGLGELLVLSWVGGNRTTQTPIFGPRGIEKVVNGFNDAYSIDATFRTAHHGPSVAHPGGFGGDPRRIDVPVGPGGERVVFEDETLKVTAVRVEHAPVEPALGFRVDYKDRSISISGDTVFHPSFVSVSRGVDVMLHEALDPEMVSTIGDALLRSGQTNNAKIFTDILDYHATPEDAARAAQKADATELVLYHLVPPLPVKMLESIFLGSAKSEFDGPILVGEDGIIISLPAGSKKILHARAF